MSNRSKRYSHELKEEAFYLYCDGLAGYLVAKALQEKYGAEEAPSREAVRQWAHKYGWQERRKQLREKAQAESDEQRVRVMADQLSRLYGLWDKLMRDCEKIHSKTTSDRPIRDLANVDRMIHVHEGRLDDERPGQDDIRTVVEHIFKVLYADEEVGPVLARRKYQIDAALERSRTLVRR